MEQQAQSRHIPVLLDQCVDLLAPALNHPGAVLVDATLGMGGHSEAVLQRFPDVRLIGIDRDLQALDLAGKRLAVFGDRFTPVHAVYDQMAEVLDDLDLQFVDGVLMDLGISSLQIDERERGFSYSQDAPLDMRMDQTADLTAAVVLSTYDEKALTRVIWEFGEERYARQIARAVVRTRQTEPLTRTSELVRVIESAIPIRARMTGGHPAKRTFQALRIEVNAELQVLERTLPQAISRLAVGGRIVVEAYHSLEDRMVKRAFAAGATSGAPRGLPVEPAALAPYLELVTRGALRAGPAEMEFNPRAASVRLRAAQRVRLGGMK